MHILTLFTSNLFYIKKKKLIKLWLSIIFFTILCVFFIRSASRKNDLNEIEPKTEYRSFNQKVYTKELEEFAKKSNTSLKVWEYIEDVRTKETSYLEGF